MAARAKPRAPRKIRPGTSADRRPGTLLSCAVLSTGPEEWAGVDLQSGAFVRVSAGAAVGRWAPFDVATLEVGPDTEPPDPSRPEAVALTDRPVLAGQMRRRAAARLLRRLAAPEQQGLAILGTRGPSIAYMDLDMNMASMVLVATNPKDLRCFVRPDGAVACSFSWGGTTQALPLLDARVRASVVAHPPEPLSAAELNATVGGRPGYLLVGLSAVRGGHAPKVVLTVLAKRPRPRLRTSEADGSSAGGESSPPSPHTSGESSINR